jgi:hypothetical protein
LRVRPSGKNTGNLANPTSLRRLLENRLFIGEKIWDKRFDLSTPKEKLVYLGRDNKFQSGIADSFPENPMRFTSDR